MLRERLTYILSGLACGTVCATDIPAPFYEEAIQRGVLYLVMQGEFDGSGQFGCGVSLADLDNDDDPDLVCVGASNGRTGLFVNDGTGHFTRVITAGLPDLNEASGVTAADYDGDGDLDLHFTCWHMPDLLYRNDSSGGTFLFTDVTSEAGMSGAKGPGTGAAWSDFDLDGDLDLYVANRTGSESNWTPNQFWLNHGDGTFTDIAAQHGLDDLFATMQPVWFDYDLDGDPDLYLSTDKGGSNGSSNRLFRNDLGQFTEVSDESRANVAFDSMGVGLGDLDSNGYLDLYCTNIPAGNAMLMNEGDGTFKDMTQETETGSFATGWGAHFFDFDNDADDDLYVCNMSDGLNRLYVNDREFPLTDMAPYCGVQCLGDSYCMAIGDVDLDGDLDIVVQNHLELIKLFINTEGEKRNWVKFKVRGVDKNKFAVGTSLTATVDGHETLHEITAGSSYKSSNDYIQHFGLGEAEQLEELRVRFTRTGTRVFSQIPANETWTILPMALLGDVDEDGDVDPADLSSFIGRLDAPDFQKGWEVLDFDGNFRLEESDLDAFLEVYEGPLEDCDGDGIIDAVQIARGDSEDADLDGRIDDCDQDPPVGDLDGDGIVDGADLTQLLAWWDTSWPPGDLDMDGTIDGSDLLILLGNWSN